MKAAEKVTYLTVYKYLHSVYSVFSVFAVRSVLIQLPIQSPEGRAHCVISHFLRVWPFFFLKLRFVLRTKLPYFRIKVYTR